MEFTAFYLLVRDEFCLKESIESLRYQGVKHFFFCIPPRYWNEEHVDWKQLRDLKNLCEDYGDVFFPSWKKRDMNGKVYAEKEAFIRNKCLQKINEIGFPEDVLIVDSDEYWIPGSLDRLRRVFHSEDLCSVSVPSLSVIGLPGYPVSDGQEDLLVYVNSKAGEFIHGRCFRPSSSIDRIEEKLVYHFTATRRTMDEVIDKNRKSCHYDDPDYDFEGWIKNKLPKLKPGEKDCHMYKHWQVWSGVRHFTGLCAGTTKLEYKTFAFFAYTGASLWALLFTLTGYFFFNQWHHWNI